MKNKKWISGMIALCLALNACSSGSPPNTPVAKTTSEEIANLSIAHQKWLELMDSEHPNYALAETLTPWLWSLDPQGLKAIQSRTEILNTESSVHQNLVETLLNIKQNFVLGQNSNIRDSELLKSAVFSHVSRLQSEGAFSLQIKLQIAGAAQTLAFQKIQKSFMDKMKADTPLFAREIVTHLDPQVIVQIDAAKGKGENLGPKEIYQILKKWDRRLASYDFPAEDTNKLVIYGYVATELYNFLKEQPSVREIAKAVQEVNAIGQKFTEARFIFKTMDNYQESLSNSWTKMANGMRGLQEDIKTHPEWLDPRISDLSQKEAKRLVKNMLLGEDYSDYNPQGESILSEAQPMGKNAKMFFEGASEAANSVDNLIGGTRAMAQTLGIKIDPKIEDALNSAQKISQGVQVAQQVAQAFSSNGLMGAFSALSGSGVAALGMGPVGLGAGALMQAQMNAQLGEMNKKLDKVIALQKEILELQKQTLAKIEELSQKMDLYHQQEMLALKGIRNEVLGNREGLKQFINQKLASCTSLANRLSYAANKENLSINMISIPSTRRALAEIMADPVVRDLLEVDDNQNTSFLQCKLAMDEAFSYRQTKDTPLWSLLDVPGSNEATPFEKKEKLYDPALNYLLKYFPRQNVESQALHLPVASFNGLDAKKYYLSRKINGLDEKLAASMEAPVSVDSLEKYVSVLLSMHSVLSISVKSWKSLDSVVENALYSSRKSMSQSNSEFWLRSALQSVHTAIAQQALVAGEPLLSKLVQEFSLILADVSNCQTEPGTYCFVRQNDIMAQNLLNYYLNKRRGAPGFIESYARAYDAKNIKTLELVLGVSFINKIELQKDVQGNPTRLMLNFGTTATSTPLPTVDEINSMRIYYSSDLPRLIQMQEKIADELSKVSRNSLLPEQQKLLTELILFQR